MSHCLRWTTCHGALRGVQGLAGGDREAAVGVREMRNGAPVEFFFYHYSYHCKGSKLRNGSYLGLEIALSAARRIISVQFFSVRPSAALPMRE
jgi:hypothetical protein